MGAAGEKDELRVIRILSDGKAILVIAGDEDEALALLIVMTWNEMYDAECLTLPHEEMISIQGGSEAEVFVKTADEWVKERGKGILAFMEGYDGDVYSRRYSRRPSARFTVWRSIK